VETEITMSVKLVDARFPPYEKVIPKASERQVVVTRLPLLEALRRASLISRDKTAALRLHFGADKLTVASDNPDVGEASEEIDIQHQGEELVMGFNGRYIVDTLQSLDAESIVLELNGATDACVIKPFEDPGYVGVVMPMRL
jgi:DNA polymerase-3 subunit beta